MSVVPDNKDFRLAKVLNANILSRDYEWAESVFETVFVKAAKGNVTKRKKGKKNAFWEVKMEYDEVVIIWKCRWIGHANASALRGVRGNLAIVRESDLFSNLAIENLKYNHREVKII